MPLQLRSVFLHTCAAHSHPNFAGPMPTDVCKYSEKVWPEGVNVPEGTLQAGQEEELSCRPGFTGGVTAKCTSGGAWEVTGSCEGAYCHVPSPHHKKSLTSVYYIYGVSADLIKHGLSMAAFSQRLFSPLCTKDFPKKSVLVFRYAHLCSPERTLSNLNIKLPFECHTHVLLVRCLLLPPPKSDFRLTFLPSSPLPCAGNCNIVPEGSTSGDLTVTARVRDSKGDPVANELVRLEIWPIGVIDIGAKEGATSAEGCLVFYADAPPLCQKYQLQLPDRPSTETVDLDCEGKFEQTFTLPGEDGCRSLSLMRSCT